MYEQERPFDYPSGIAHLPCDTCGKRDDCECPLDDIHWLGLTDEEVDLIYDVMSRGITNWRFVPTAQSIVRAIDQYRVGDWRHPSEEG